MVSALKNARLGYVFTVLGFYSSRDRIWGGGGGGGGGFLYIVYTMGGTGNIVHIMLEFTMSVLILFMFLFYILLLLLLLLLLLMM